jgi:hypothetical protein
MLGSGKRDEGRGDEGLGFMDHLPTVTTIVLAPVGSAPLEDRVTATLQMTFVTEEPPGGVPSRWGFPLLKPLVRVYASLVRSIE